MMKITVKRSGGFAGLTEMLADLDTHKVDPDSARQVSEIVEKAGLFDYPAVIPGGEIGADMQRYEITASDGGRSHSITFSEGSTEAAPLLDLVQKLRKFQ
jgi:hypothetical protein